MENLWKLPRVISKGLGWPVLLARRLRVEDGFGPRGSASAIWARRLPHAPSRGLELRSWAPSSRRRVITRSATLANCRSWVTFMTVRARAANLTASKTWRFAAGSSPTVGSSRSRSRLVGKADVFDCHCRSSVFRALQPGDVANKLLREQFRHRLGTRGTPPQGAGHPGQRPHRFLQGGEVGEEHKQYPELVGCDLGRTGHYHHGEVDGEDKVGAGRELSPGTGRTTEANASSRPARSKRPAS